MCAVKTCCTVGAALGPEGAEKEEKLEAEGDDGVGECVESSRSSALRTLMSAGHKMAQHQEHTWSPLHVAACSCSYFSRERRKDCPA